jgi:hypothetical protein
MSLQVWLPLTKDLRQQGLSNVTMSGSPVSWTDGKLGKAATWNGNVVNCVYNNTSDFNYTNNFSVAVWYKHKFTSGATQYAFTVGRADAGGYGYGLQPTAATQAYFRFGSAVYPVNSLVQDAWYHLVMTIGNNKVTIYKDGVQISSNNMPGTLPTYSDGNGLGLGCFHYGSNIYPFYGSLNDFRIYDHCLSPMEVKELSKGLVLHYPLNRMGFGQENLALNSYINTTNDSYNTANFNLSEDIIAGETYTVTFKGTLGTGKTYFGMWMGGGYTMIGRFVEENGIYTLHFTGPSTIAGDGSRSRINIYAVDWSVNATNSILWCKVEKGSKATPWCPNSSDAIATTIGLNSTIEYDTSGFCNNANSNGSVALTYSSDVPKYNVSTVFTSGARIATPVSASTFMPTDAITVSIWFKSSNASNRFLSCTEGGGFNFESASGKISFPIYVAGKGYTRVDGNTTWSEVSDNKWHMITATYDKQNTILYVDGQLDKSTASSYPNINIGYSTTAPFTLGAEAQSITSPIAGTYVGNLSDCRVYATALSAEDIKSLYQNEAAIDGQGNILGPIR